MAQNHNLIFGNLLLDFSDVFRSKAALTYLMSDLIKTNPSLAKSLLLQTVPRGMRKRLEESGTIPSSSCSHASALLLDLAIFGDFHTFAIGMGAVRIC